MKIANNSIENKIQKCLKYQYSIKLCNIISVLEINCWKSFIVYKISYLLVPNGNSKYLSWLLDIDTDNIL